MAEASTINRAQTAVLIMDYQHDIVSNVEASSPGLLDRAASVLSAARRAGVPVIYVVVRFRPGHPKVSARNKIFSGMKAAGRLAEGSPGAEIHDRVCPQANEVIVTKRRVGAFSTTDMETVLRAQNVTLCGQKIQMSLFPFGYGVSPPRVAPLDFTPTPSHSQ